MEIINIAKDFSDAPAGRYKKQGPDSGEEFREKILLPKLKHSLKNGEKLKIILDGTLGYPPSFLEESFGGVVRVLKKEYTKEEIKNTLVFVSNEEPSLVDEINEYIDEA